MIPSTMDCHVGGSLLRPRTVDRFVVVSWYCALQPIASIDDCCAIDAMPACGIVENVT